jgi:hypothetical protein
MSTEQPRPRRRRRKSYTAGLPVRGTPEEIAAIRANARRAHRSASRFLVELGTREDAPDRLPSRAPEDRAALEELTYQLRKVGVNLNQLAHRENSADVGGSALPPTDAELQEAARAVTEAVQQIRERLR